MEENTSRTEVWKGGIKDREGVLDAKMREKEKNRDILLWAAGFFDGEGSITIQKANRYSLQVSIAGSNLPYLRLFSPLYER